MGRGGGGGWALGKDGKGPSSGVAELKGDGHFLCNTPQLLPTVCMWLSLTAHSLSQSCIHKS